MSRIGTFERETFETKVRVKINLDGSGKCVCDTGIGFFDHMIVLLSKHSGFDIEIKASGDLVVDTHHTVEDIGIAFGKAFCEAIGDKVGINRYATFFLPMDEVLARVSLDLSGRSYLVYESPFTAERIGAFECETLKDFLVSFTDMANLTLHVKILEKGNNHHMCEAIFKGLGRALKDSVEIVSNEIPSSKGVL